MKREHIAKVLSTRFDSVFKGSMINPKNLLKELNKREDDSNRLDAILDTLMWHCMDALDFKDHFMYYDREFKIFTVRSRSDDSEEVFKDGREAIDYCISPSSDEPEPDFADFSEQSEALANKTSSDEVKADDNEAPINNTEKGNN